MDPTKVYDLGQILGDCGIFQIIISLATNAATMVAAWAMLFMAFGIYNPGWTCVVNTNSSSKYYFEYTTVSMPFAQMDDNNINDSRWSYECYHKKYCKNPVYNPSSSTIVTEWDLSCDSARIPQVIISIQMIGVLIGSYVSGQVGDRFGRKASLYCSIGFLSIMELLAAFSVSWKMYAVITFFIGFGTGGILACSFVYPIEFVSEWWRGILTALPTWNIGCGTFAIAIFVLRDWRYVHIATAVLSAFVFLPVFWIPESVRWLTVNGKCEKAKSIVADIARMNGKSCQDTSIIDEIAAEEKISNRGHNYTYLDLFKIASIRCYTIKFGFMWITVAISYYAISFGIKSLFGDFYINFFIFSIIEIPCMIFVAPAVNKLGRRKAALLYFAVAAASSSSVAIVAFTASDNIKDISILVLALICRMFIIGVWFLICVYSAELYPTVVRSIHFGYLNGVARIGSVVSPYLIPNEADKLYIPFLTIAILLFIAFGSIWTLPDTKGRVLEDRAKDKDHQPQSMQTMLEESSCI